MKKIHILQHVDFEGPECIAEWAIEKGHQLSYTKFYNGHSIPSPETIDWLVVMGGPMGAYEDDKYPWMKAEKFFISECIKVGKTVIGICLGSQIVASCLGAKVYPHKDKEIGWFPVKTTKFGQKHPLMNKLNPELTVFHWHGDTFDIPEGAELLLSSQATVNQAFIYEDRVLGFQFHIEITEAGIIRMIDNFKSQIVKSKWIQTPGEMLINKELIVSNNKIMRDILNNLP